MDKLKISAEKLGISLSEEQLGSFKRYMELLLYYNERMNLTAITDKDGILTKHFLDSMTFLLSEKAEHGMSLIDIGAGAGFPSLPIKIARPDLRVTMLDSLNKRVGFLNTVVSELGLSDITAVHMRAEDGGRSEMRESFDLATARAVADLSPLAEYALPFVRVGGYFVALKGTAPEEEINASKPAIKLLGGRIESVKDICIGDGELNHTLVIVKKLEKTPAKYPRKAGKPVKEPLREPVGRSRTIKTKIPGFLFLISVRTIRKSPVLYFFVGNCRTIF